MKNRRAWGRYFVGAIALIAIILTARQLSELFATNEREVNQAKVLNRGLIGEPESLDNHQFSSDQAADVLRDTGEGLVTIAADGSLIPGVAESWEVSEDGLRYVFKIRHDASWSNGVRVTADDFVSTYRSLVDPKHAAVNANALQAVQNASKIVGGVSDVATLGVLSRASGLLEIHLQSPTPYFLQLLSHPSLYPVYSGAVGQIDSSRGSRISNGAYVLEQWTKGSEIVLTKNTEYWNSENVFFDVVKYHIVEEGAEFNRFRAGELDVTGTVGSGIFPVAQREFSNELKVAPRLGIYYYGFNLTNPLFAENLDLRRALSLAIDRRQLVDSVVGRGEEPAYGWVPPGTYNYESQKLLDLELEKEARELQARQFFKAAGYGATNILSFELRYNRSDVQERIALAISGMWREVLGVEVTLVGEEFQVLLANIRAQEVTDVFRLSWTGNYNDAQNFLELFESDHSQNLTGYRNSEYDDLIRAARAEVDPSNRKSLLESAERMVLSDHPVIPIYFYVSKHLVSDRISGWDSNVLDIHLSQHLHATQ